VLLLSDNQRYIESMTNATGVIGVIAIGRNEGERLKRCLESVQNIADCVVYVDSGSNDGSLGLARTLASAVLELDLNTPFTAARARNEGFAKLLQMEPAVQYVFFVDGDCEVVSGWLEKARRFLDEHQQHAVAWGIRRERHPEKSVYNLICDIEWRDYPLGETLYCGGDALIRVSALKQVHGYRSELICGEEPEMCVRLREAGWRIFHMTENMTIHDVAMYRFGQWWKRVLRGGYGYAQGAALHGAAPERLGVTESRRAWIWGLFIPLATIVLSLFIGWKGLLLLAIYPLQIARLASRGNYTLAENWLRAMALVVGRFAEMLGQVKFLIDRFKGARARLIEYK
jgi:glycosyltransferase involved in cell wall biosynthesis